MNKHTFFSNRSHGITLVEIVIALFLLSIIMVPVLSTLGAGTRGIQITHEELLAHHAGAELMEELMALPFELLPIGSFPNSAIADGQPIGSDSSLKFHISASPNIQRGLTISELRSDGKLKYKRIEVTIFLLGRDGKPTGRTVVMKSMLANETI